MRLLSNQSQRTQEAKIFLGILSFTLLSSSSLSLSPICPILKAGGNMWRTIHMYNICLASWSLPSWIFLCIINGRVTIEQNSIEGMRNEGGERWRNLPPSKVFGHAKTVDFVMERGLCSVLLLLLARMAGLCWDLTSSSWNSAGSFISQGQRAHWLLSIIYLLLLEEG